MMYRLLDHSETTVLDHTLYAVRGLSGGAATSLLMAFKTFAMREDKPEFEIFQNSERDRLQSSPVDKETLRSTEDTDGFFRLLGSGFQQDSNDGKASTALEWFYGDESKLDAQHKRLRVLFFNSKRHREQVLSSGIRRGVISIDDLDDVAAIKDKLEEFQHKFSGKRTGVITNYEILFGDPAGFSYMTAMARQEFHTKPEARRAFLEFYRLPVNWAIFQVKNYLRETALRSASFTEKQVEAWDSLGRLENGKRR